MRILLLLLLSIGTCIGQVPLGKNPTYQAALTKVVAGGGGGSPPSRVQNVSSSQLFSGLGRHDKSFTNSVTGGNAVAGFVMWNDTSTLSTVTDNKGNTYTMLHNPMESGGNRLAAFYSLNVSGGSSFFITNVFSGTPSVQIMAIWEVSGATGFDSSNTNAFVASSGTDGFHTGLTTTAANTLLMSVAYNYGQVGTDSAGTGSTIREVFASSFGVAVDKQFTGTGNVTNFVTTTGVAAHNGGIIALKP